MYRFKTSNSHLDTLQGIIREHCHCPGCETDCGDHRDDTRICLLNCHDRFCSAPIFRKLWDIADYVAAIIDDFDGQLETRQYKHSTPPYITTKIGFCERLHVTYGTINRTGADGIYKSVTNLEAYVIPSCHEIINIIKTITPEEILCMPEKVRNALADIYSFATALLYK